MIFSTLNFDSISRIRTKEIGVCFALKGSFIDECKITTVLVFRSSEKKITLCISEEKALVQLLVDNCFFFYV